MNKLKGLIALLLLLLSIYTYSENITMDQTVTDSGNIDSDTISVLNNLTTIWINDVNLNRFYSSIYTDSSIVFFESQEPVKGTDKIAEMYTSFLNKSKIIK